MKNCQLAKIYNTEKLPKSDKYFITEKLDGNRCIAEYTGEKWVFYSRQGNELFVNFDMTNCDKTKVYDGEVIKTEQWQDRKQSDFNALNGLIQSQIKNKRLVYVIFDYQDETEIYENRRKHLDSLKNSSNVFVLPLLKVFDIASQLQAQIEDMLNNIVDLGGEGLMINCNTPYITTRTVNLLKVKQTKSIEMLVTGITEGQGKCNGMIGALKCECTTDDGKIIKTEVGGGFTDKERTQWTDKSIIGKIVEIEYFSLSQNEYTKGTNTYSLRFPRYKRIRMDKTVTTDYISYNELNENAQKEPIQSKAENKPQNFFKRLWILITGGAK